MSAVGLEGLERTVQLTHVWINDLNDRLAWNDKSRAYRMLKSVLHALRDWLRPEESADFAAQLPALLRGAYYEGWRPVTTPVKARSKADFLARIQADFKQDPLSDPARDAMHVFELLSDNISSGEVADVRHALPEDLRNLWPERYHAPGDHR